MNLFLLVSVPLAAVVLHRWLSAERSPWTPWSSWAQGAVWSLLALIVVTPFQRLRVFEGTWWTGLGLTLTDALLVPGLVVAAWVLSRRTDRWELGLWLALVFTFAGLRDFLATSRVDDATELFLVPLYRILLLVTLPWLVSQAQTSERKLPWIAAAAALALVGPWLQTLSLFGWWWLVAVIEGGALTTVLWLNKNAVPKDGVVFSDRRD